MFFNQLKAVVLAMQAIRSVNPRAQLIQTEDLGKTHSTHLLKYQASFENERRWLTNDVLSGKLNEDHFFWNYLLQLGLAPSTLEFFLKNPTPPSVIGFNYYVTSERWLDHRVANYPVALHGGNGRHTYVDIEAVRAGKPLGLPVLLREAWNRYKLPLAITECHLNCTREEQMRWLGEVWDQSCKLARSGIDIKAVTAWSLLGAYDWNSLLTQKNNHYEPGVFDVSTGKPRITALGKMIRSYSSSASFDHPLLQQKGWWHTKDANPLHNKSYIDNTKPLLIIGNTGTLGYAFTMVCKQRSIPFTSLGRKDINICDARSIEEVIEAFQPWAIVNATGYVRVDDAETDAENCFAVNATAPSLLARACFERGVRFMTFSSDLVFDGLKLSPYDETDEAIPLNVYGKSKAEGEKMTLLNNPEALIIRTSAFFGPWDQYNFAYNVLKAIKTKSPMALPDDITVSPTYIPDLCHTAMDLFIDGETAIWHLANEGVVTWSGFGDIIAARSGCKNHRLTAKPSNEMGWRAKRPFYSVLQSGKGVRLPKLELAVERFFEQQTF
jgi:dTDP-4-dehydrorhamnose reductase